MCFEGILIFHTIYYITSKFLKFDVKSTSIWNIKSFVVVHCRTMQCMQIWLPDDQNPEESRVKTISSTNIHPPWLTKHALVALPLLQALSIASCLQACKANRHALLAKEGEKRERSHNFLQYITACQSPKYVV